MTPDQLEQFLSDLATKLGPAGQHVYELAVRQQIINGIEGLVGAFCLLLLTVFLFWVARYAWTHESYEAAVPTGIAAGMGLMAAAGTGLLFTVGLNALLNPEWQAIQTLLSAATGAGK